MFASACRPVPASAVHGRETRRSHLIPTLATATALPAPAEKEPFHARDADEAIDRLRTALVEHVALHAPDHVFVRGGAVAMGGRAIVLPGEPEAGLRHSLRPSLARVQPSTRTGTCRSTLPGGFTTSPWKDREALPPSP